MTKKRRCFRVQVMSQGHRLAAGAMLGSKVGWPTIRGTAIYYNDYCRYDYCHNTNNKIYK